MSTATYTKLKSGEWGIRIQGAATKGGQVTVTKKSGETKVETVDRVLWSGSGITLCTIGHSAHSKSGCCVNCGDHLDRWEISHGVRRCAECRDGGSRAHGGMSYHDRHGNFVLGDDD